MNCQSTWSPLLHFVLPAILSAAIIGCGPSSPNRTEIPFAVFHDQLAADNIEQVEIRGGEALGSFKQPPKGEYGKHFRVKMPDDSEQVDHIIQHLQEQGVPYKNIEEK